MVRMDTPVRVAIFFCLTPARRRIWMSCRVSWFSMPSACYGSPALLRVEARVFRPRPRAPQFRAPGMGGRLGPRAILRSLSGRPSASARGRGLGSVRFSGNDGFPPTGCFGVVIGSCIGRFSVFGTGHNFWNGGGQNFWNPQKLLQRNWGEVCIMEREETGRACMIADPFYVGCVSRLKDGDDASANAFFRWIRFKALVAPDDHAEVLHGACRRKLVGQCRSAR